MWLRKNFIIRKPYYGTVFRFGETCGCGKHIVYTKCQKRIKLQPYLIESVQREIRTLYEVSRNPNFVQVIRSWRENNTFVIEMEYCDQNFMEVITDCYSKPGQRFVEKFLWEVIHDIALGLAYLHRTGTAHRDIKPANILIERGKIKIADLGLAKVLSEFNTFAGTQRYQAPEIQTNRYEVSVDIYALGIMMREAMTGAILPAQIPTPEALWNTPYSEVLKSLVIACANPPESRPTAREMYTTAAQKYNIELGETIQSTIQELRSLDYAIDMVSNNTELQAIRDQKIAELQRLRQSMLYEN